MGDSKVDLVYECRMCKERGKDWHGDDPTCAFLSADRSFSPLNWNCATVNAIRDIVSIYYSQEDRPPGTTLTFCEDQRYATIRVTDIIEGHFDCLWLTWYKSRGKTESMWLLGSHTTRPRLPTEDECLAIIEGYKEFVE